MVDILAIAAHRDDVEQTCGGTLLKMAELGHRTGILDLTQGELGTRGDVHSRATEAAEAARILQVKWREALDIPDGRVVVLPYWQGRHPDHYTCSTLGYEACFLSGLAKLDLGAQKSLPHRPFKIVYATLYHDVRPTFVVDITAQFERRIESLLAYHQQFSDQGAGSGIFPARAEIRERVTAMAAYYGLLGGVRYAEPFLQKEVGLVDDLMQIPVKSL